MANGERILVNVSEVAAMLCVSRPTVYQLMRREDFPAAVKIGSRRLIHLAKLEEWAAKQTEVR